MIIQLYYYTVWQAELQCFFDYMKKHIPLLISISFVVLYLLWLILSSLFFMPASGYRIHDRTVSEDVILAGRDSSSRHNASRELLPGEKIDLNTADADTLQLLRGIGPSLSSAIIDYRQEHGPFQSIEDLLLVPGIGEKKYAAVCDYITVGGFE